MSSSNGHYPDESRVIESHAKAIKSNSNWILAFKLTMVPAQRYVHSTKVGPRDTSDQAGIHSVPVEPTVDRSFFTGPNRALRSKAIGILALGLILAQFLVCVQGSRDTVPENNWYNAPRPFYYARHEKRAGPMMDHEDIASYSGRSVLFPRTSRENPVSMLRLKKMSMMRLKKDNGEDVARMEGEIPAPLRLGPIHYYNDNGDLVNKRMSMMRLKKPSMMRLRRMPSSNAVSMLRLKKGVTQLRLKKDGAVDDDKENETDSSENNCLWYNDRCLNLNEA